MYWWRGTHRPHHQGEMASVAPRPLPLLVAGLRERIALRRLPEAAELRAIRLQAGLTQEELAQELGCSRIAIGRYETGRRRPQGALAERYGRILRLLKEATAS